MPVSTDPTYPLFQVFAFLGFVLSVIPLSWHIQAWNSGTCAFMIWTGLACLNSFINSIVWAGNVNNPAPVWCDISSKIIIGVSVGIPAATLCISRRLYYLTAGNTVSITRDDKRRMVIIDLLIAAGMPVIIMILHYIIQGHRFDIIEDIGCYPVVYNTLPSYFLYFMWSPLFGCISFVFSAMTLRSFWLRRLQFSQLISSKSSMSISRYLRLVLLALIDIMCTIPIGIYAIYIGNKGVVLAPWVSWEDTHFNFSRVGRVPSLIWRSNSSYRMSLELSQWLPIVCAVVFFALFGFAAEAQKHYKFAFWMVMKPFGVKPALKPLSSFKSFSWNKAKATNPDMDSLPPYSARSHPSPMSPTSIGKKLDHASSFSTAASLGVGGEYELGTYDTKHANYTSSVVDIEKTAGLTFPHSLDADSMQQLPMHRIRPQLEEPTNGFVLLPSPTSPTSSFPVQQGLPPLETAAASPSSTLLSAPAPIPKQKTSNSSLRTILSPDRDRFYIHPIHPSRKLSADSDLSNFPTTPPPFVNTAVPVESAGVDGYRRQFIQVMVHKTETKSIEP